MSAPRNAIIHSSHSTAWPRRRLRTVLRTDWEFAISGWTVQLLIDCEIAVTACCRGPAWKNQQNLNLEALKDKLGSDAYAMHGDLAPKMRCAKCGNKGISLSYSPRRPRLPSILKVLITTKPPTWPSRRSLQTADRYTQSRQISAIPALVVAMVLLWKRFRIAVFCAIKLTSYSAA